MKNFDEFFEDFKDYFYDKAVLNEEKLSIVKNDKLDFNSLSKSRMNKENLRNVLSYLLCKENEHKLNVVAFNNHFDYFKIAFLYFFAGISYDFKYKNDSIAEYNPNDFSTNDGTIYINLNKIKGDDNLKLIETMQTFYHEMEHSIQNKDYITILNENSYYGIDTLYNFILEDIIISNVPKSYNKIYGRLSCEKLANTKAIEKIYDLLFLEKPDNQINLNKRASKINSLLKFKEELVRFHSKTQDNIILKQNKYLDVYKILNLEYEKDGRRKSLSQIVKNTALKEEDLILYYSIIRRTVYSLKIEKFIIEKNKFENKDILIMNKFFDVELNSLTRKIKLEEHLGNTKTNEFYTDKALEILEFKENLNARKKVKN